MKVSLVVLSSGSAEGKALPVTLAQFTIGRDPQCNLRPASAMISKRHCAVLIKNGQVFLRDFDSTNGTFLNDQQVKGEVLLKDGDILKVGPLTFKAVIEAMPAPTKPTPAPKPKGIPANDEEAAAALLSIDEAGETSTTDTGAEAAEGGSTLMEIPIFTPAGEQIKQDEPAPADQKQAAKKPVTGAAQDAAKAILEKLRQGKRK